MLLKIKKEATLKELQFLLRRMSQTKLANMMSINKTNITNWLAFGRVPKKRIIQLKEIKNELAIKIN